MSPFERPFLFDGKLLTYLPMSSREIGVRPSFLVYNFFVARKQDPTLATLKYAHAIAQ